MKIKFTGVPGESHESIHMYGLDFPLGKFVDVTAPVAARKLSAHPHFAVKPGDEPEDVETKTTETEHDVSDTSSDEQAAKPVARKTRGPAKKSAKK